MIFFLGDTHGRFDHILPAIRRRREAGDRVEAVVFLGDIEAPCPFEELIAPLLAEDIDAYFIHGNHDTDCEACWNNLFGSEQRNLHGRGVTIGGLRVAGLGGVFRGEIWYPRASSNPAATTPQFRSHAEYLEWLAVRQPLRLRGLVASSGNARKHASSIFPDAYDLLADLEADILVTHEAPSCHPHGFDAIDLLAQTLGVRAVLHGHHHDCLDYRPFDKGLGFRAHGVGFRGITDESGAIIVPGDFDESRRYRQAHPLATDGEDTR